MTTEVLLTTTTTNSNNRLAAEVNGKKARNSVGRNSSSGSFCAIEDGDDADPQRQRRLAMMVGGDQHHQQRVVYHHNISAGDGIVEGAGRLSLGSAAESPRQVRSPRCEAFVMTGEKMLSLNPKISPCYAKVCQNQLPPTAEVEEKLLLSTTPKGAFDDFPSMHHHRSSGTSRRRLLQELPAGVVPGSQSDHLLAAVEEGAAEGGELNGGGNGEQHHLNGETDQHPQQLLLQQQQLTSHSSQTTEPMDDAMVAEQKPIESFMMMSPPHNHRSLSTPATPARGAAAMQQQNVVVGEAERHHQRSGSSKLLNKQHISSRIDSATSNRSSDLLMMTAHQQSVYTPDTVARLARHIFTHKEGIKIAAFLVKSDDLSLRIAHEFVALFNFAGLRVDAALRAFLVHVHLTGESGERALLLGHFAQRYYECNPTVFSSTDEVQALTSALLLLNTDLHGKGSSPSGKKAKMSCREFIDNLAHSEYKFDHAMLRELYSAIKEQHFQHLQLGNDDPIPPQQTRKREKRLLSRKLSLIKDKQKRVGSAPVGSNAMIDPEQQVDYKHGWLLKKSVYDADGKRTPLGRRKWQMHYATVRGMVLYLHQNEHSFSSATQYVTFRNCILLHHALAEPSRDYTKRRNVFRLRTARLGELLFQTSDPNEVQLWCDALNYVAAAFSTPALPTPVGASGTVAFYRPHLPSMPTHLSIPDQLRAHEHRLDETATNLARLREQAPPMKARGKIVQDYFYRERYLESEKERYIAYVSILRDKLARASSAALHYGDSLSSNTLLLSASFQHTNHSVRMALPFSNGGGGFEDGMRPSSSLISNCGDSGGGGGDGEVSTVTNCDLASNNHHQ